VRLVAVLGYSAWRRAGLHPVCGARVAAAAGLACAEDVIVLTGRPEAELMRAAWPSGPSRVECDDGARLTADSAAHVARLARELEADEVVVVTSWWHCRRARVLFRRALRGSGVAVRTLGAPAWSGRLLLREAAAFGLLPLHLRRLEGGLAKHQLCRDVPPDPPSAGRGG
jgi:uncharacterized SAM-binding protein YcdF (DUF218 family)